MSVRATAWPHGKIVIGLGLKPVASSPTIADPAFVVPVPFLIRAIVARVDSDVFIVVLVQTPRPGCDKDMLSVLGVEELLVVVAMAAAHVDVSLEIYRKRVEDGLEWTRHV